MDAEEIVLALRIVEGRKYFGIAGVLLPELLDPPLARLVVVVPVVHRKDEAVHVDVTRLGDDLAVALDRSHAGITARQYSAASAGGSGTSHVNSETASHPPG